MKKIKTKSEIDVLNFCIICIGIAITKNSADIETVCFPCFGPICLTYSCSI